MRNFTGLLAGLALIAIATSSVNWVRRRLYGVFYRIHMVAGPTVLICAVLHWNRTILYIAGGVLYYAACSIPVWMENKYRNPPVQVVSIEAIAGSRCHPRQPCVVAVTVAATDAALREYRPGQYVRVRVPVISPIAHPFSINTTSQPGQLRFIFRRTGNFTTALAQLLCSHDNKTSNLSQAIVHQDGILPRRPNNENAVPCDHVAGTAAANGDKDDSYLGDLPDMYLEGFHGGPDRVAQILQHDMVVVVAGGIGITPYLSLLPTLQSQRGGGDGTGSLTRRIVVHWACRDPALVEYMKREYMEPLLLRRTGVKTNLQIRIIIYWTAIRRVNGDNAARQRRLSYSDLEDPQGSDQSGRGAYVQAPSDRPLAVPFIPSRFTPKVSFRDNLVPFGVFLVTAWVGLAGTLYIYFHWMTQVSILPRAYSPIFILSLGGAVSWAALRIMSSSSGTVDGHSLLLDDNCDDGPEPAGWAPTAIEDDLTESSVEMGPMKDIVPPASVAWKSNGDAATEVAPFRSDGASSAQLEEREGRPTVHQLLNSLDDAHYPGIFVCGPRSLLNDIRAATRERCLLRCQQRASGEPQIALYEETFEL
jgi:ferredoxin-NADP reductase